VLTLTVQGLNWAYDEDTQFHFGSFFQYSEATEGRMFDLTIADADWTLVSLIHSYSVRDASTCYINKYFDGSDCQECDWSCHLGCEDANTCNECHPTCKTCNHAHGGPGRADECTSCYCGANDDVSDASPGFCACDEHHENEAYGCEIKCHEGCSDCSGTGEHECVRCSRHYHMTPGCWGTCEWCDENECDEDGYPSCGVRGIFKDIECECTSG